MATIDRMHRGFIALTALLILLAVPVVGGCTPTPTAGSATPTATGPIGTSHGDPTAPPTLGPSLPTQTDTEWGRIWDALPPWFPIPDGASPTETGSGPATAELALPAESTAQAAADFFRTSFQAAGFAAVDVDGPLEDGAFVVSVPGNCQIEVRLAPLGNQVVARVLYGAGCPFE